MKRQCFVLLFCSLAIFPAGRFPAAEETNGSPKPSPDGATLWHDCQDLTIEGKGWNDTASHYDRLPAKAQGKVPDAVWNLGHDSAGLCVRFATNASSIEVRWSLRGRSLAMPHMPATGVSGVDLYTQDKVGRWHFVGNGRPAGKVNTARFDPPAGQPCLLYLPLYNGVESVKIGIPKNHRLCQPQKTDRPQHKPVVFYGTSITQGGCASRPGMACTAIVGRRLDVPVINLGFSGNGRMETIMADLLAELDPSVYVLDCLWNMKPAEITERTEPFVRRLRRSHPDTPILLAEDSSVEDASPTEKGRIVREIHAKLTADGVKQLYCMSNKGMLGDDGEGTVDGCHPNDLGMMRQADTFIQALRPLVQPAPR